MGRLLGSVIIYLSIETVSQDSTHGYTSYVYAGKTHLQSGSNILENTLFRGRPSHAATAKPKTQLP